MLLQVDFRRIPMPNRVTETEVLAFLRAVESGEVTLVATH